MKRSEMLKVIIKGSSNYNPFPMSHREADFILKAIEEAGMFPPPQQPDSKSTEKYMEWVENAEEKYEVWKWEPEDEK